MPDSPQDGYTALLKTAFNYGVGTVFALVLLYIVYVVALAEQKSNAQQLQSVKSDTEATRSAAATLIDQHDAFRSGMQTAAENQTKAIIRSCQMTAQAFQQNPDDCLPQ